MRHDQGSEFCGGPEDAEVMHQALFGRWNLGADSTHEILGRHEEVGSAVVSLLGELEHDLIGLVANELLVGERGLSELATQILKTLAA